MSFKDFVDSQISIFGFEVFRMEQRKEEMDHYFTAEHFNHAAFDNLLTSLLHMHDLTFDENQMEFVCYAIKK